MAELGELTRVDDTDQDGRANHYQTIYRWPLSGNYHEYSHGPVFLPDGDMLVNLNLSWIGYGYSLAEWRGWMVIIPEEGGVTALATGRRSPRGVGVDGGGALFSTDNTGDWVASGWV